MKMMKKIVVLVLLLSVLIPGMSAMAETRDIERFADYTDVDLNVFINKGYSCDYNDFMFSAELSPVNNTIEAKGSHNTYTIKFDIKVLYSAGSCILVPRIIFTREGSYTYYDNRMSNVYICNGGNRYKIDVTDCSRSSSSQDRSATDLAVKPMYIGGQIMLEDLALYPQSVVKVKMGNSGDFELTDADKKLISDFYADCQEAGIFNQPFLNQSDDYHILTLFNENSVVATEETIVEESTPDNEQ